MQILLIPFRTWIVTYGDEHRFVTARQEPKLTTIATSIHDNYIHLDAKGHPTLKLPVKMELTKHTKVIPVRYEIRGICMCVYRLFYRISTLRQFDESYV